MKGAEKDHERCEKVLVCNKYVLLDQGVSVPVSCAFAKLVGVDCVQVQSRAVAQCVQTTLCT